MGDLDRDTALAGEDGRYTAALSRDWEIWGPNGGYIAAILLRAAGTASAFPVPAPLSVHYLARGSFDEVQLTVRSLRRTRRAEAVAVSMTQGDRHIAEGLAWFVDADLAGLEHDVTEMPSVPLPETVPTMAERNAEVGIGNPFTFWDNVENRMLDWRSEWPPPGPLPPTSDSWFRFLPTATFDDPLVDAARLVVVLDTVTLRPAAQVRLRHPGAASVLRSLAVRSLGCAARARRCAGASRSSAVDGGPDRRSRT